MPTFQAEYAEYKRLQKAAFAAMGIAKAAEEVARAAEIALCKRLANHKACVKDGDGWLVISECNSWLHQELLIDGSQE